MNVLRADALGLCFGVRDAIAVAAAVDDPKSVTIHGELVHNECVLVQLRSQGFSMTREADRAALPHTPAVLITAHGISDRERARLESAGKRLIDTTCPLVRHVHRCARALESEGFHVLVIGRPEHVEVRGIVEDLSACDVLSSPEDVRCFGRSKLGIVCQTTTPPHVARQIGAAVRACNPNAEIRTIDTICQPTRDRQDAVDRLARCVDAMIVVGGKNSNNTRELVGRCRAANVRVWHVQSAADLDRGWFEGVATVGLTAGTSTLDETIEEVYQALRRLPGGIPQTSEQWVRHFERNAQAAASIDWRDPRRLSETERIAVGRSIQIFQLGESGQGSRLLRAAERHARRIADPAYIEAVRLFVREEQRHAALLAGYLQREGLNPLRRQWSNGIFRRLRNLAGLDLMLTVLLTAELIAKAYYLALRRATRCPVLRAVCSQILRDEAWHVRFQCQRLALLRRGRPWASAVCRWTARAVYEAACLVVWRDHAPVFRAAGMDFRAFRLKTQREFADALRSITAWSAESQTNGGTPAASEIPRKQKEHNENGRHGDNDCQKQAGRPAKDLGRILEPRCAVHQADGGGQR